MLRRRARKDRDLGSPAWDYMKAAAMFVDQANNGYFPDNGTQGLDSKRAKNVALIIMTYLQCFLSLVLQREQLLRPRLT